MQKSYKAMLIGAIAAMAVAWPVAAQSSQNNLGSLTSDTRTATAGIFKTDVDNYMDVARFSTVKFDKWFGFITGNALTVSSDINSGTVSNPASGKLNMGYARNLSEKVYLGAWYQGNIVQVTGAADTNSKQATWNTTTQEQTSYTETTTYVPGWVNSNNHIELLFGVGGNGFKIGFHESLYNNRHAGAESTVRTVSVVDNLSGTVTYNNKVDEFSVNGGFIRPYIGWGTEIKLGDDMGLRPYANFGLGAVINSQIDKFSNYSVVNGQRGNVTTTYGAGYNNGYVNPYGDIGAKLDLKTKGGASATVELKYGISGNAWSNSADNIGLGGTYNGTVGWNAGHVNQKTEYVDRTVTDTDVTLLINERTDITNTITPAYVITKEVADGFKLGFIASLPFTFRSYSSDQYTETRTKMVTEYNPGSILINTTATSLSHAYTGVNTNNPTENSSFNMALNLGIGATYKLIPDRFTVNAGISAPPANFTNETVTIKPRQYT
ncbi:MAG: hypothetical protein FWG46_03720, partial [Treponema sp.]|nr:hypothetical protein [Treponema sp.]